MSFPSTCRPIRVALALLSVLGACDWPTSAPRWDTVWDVPGESTTIGVGQVLPAGVTVAGDAFAVAVAPVTITRTLGQDCPACSPLAGRTAPKPAFGPVAFSASAALPAGVASATVAGGSRVDVSVANGYGFDPLRPAPSTGAGGTGWLVLEVRSGDVLLGRDSVNGATTALPAGGTLGRSIPLAGTVAGPITTQATLFSPAGEPTSIDPSRQLRVTATPTVRVSQSTVSVTNAVVSQSVTTTIDLSGAVADRVRGGTLQVAVTDPVGARGPIQLRVTGPGVDVAPKTIALAGGNRTYPVTFTAEELRSMLRGEPVTLTFTGPVSVASASLTPTQRIGITTRMQFTVSTTTD